jgi:alkylation response protein AidB-like acyl-CoA dehydrogenase
MRDLLTDQHRKRYDEFQAFVAVNVEPYVAQWDCDQRIPQNVIAKVAEAGYFGCSLPRVHGGHEWDAVTFGLLHEAFGRASSALTDVLTVQTMVAMTLLKWGTADQKQRWLRPLATGDLIGAFALTEPGAGSDTNGLATRFSERDDVFVLKGTKKWISAGQFADVFLVFGNLGVHSMVCPLPRGTPGLHVEPICELLGFRAAGLAELHFDDVQVSAADIIGKPGFALSHIAPVGLHHGRISTSCSALGLLRACFEAGVEHAARRTIGQQAVGDLGMIRSLIARMGSDLAAGNSLCLDACRAEDARVPSVFEAAMTAKHFVSRAAARAASDAVQICGASGCHASAPVSRYYRDAKIMEIIEGTTQVHEDMLGRLYVEQAGRRTA